MAEIFEEGVRTSLEEMQAVTALVSHGYASYGCEPSYFGLSLTKRRALSVEAQEKWDELVVEYGWTVVSEDRIETGRRRAT